MFDTMTLTKIVGSLCGALLILLMGKWAAELLYDTSPGHGGDHHEQAYVIDTGTDDQGGGDEDAGPSFAEMWQTADVEKGAKVFGKCKACHKLEDGANATGPYLYGVVGRKVDSADGFTSYSGALEQVVDVWTPENLSHFLENPKGFAPGTGMTFSGLKKPEDRVNLIAYLDDTDGDRTEIAAAAEGAATQEAAPEETATQEAATEEAATQEASTEEAANENAATGGAESGFAAMVASADLAKGEKVFKKCKACHALEDGKNRVGPHLYKLVGREIGGVDGFKYSDAIGGKGGTWTEDDLDAFLEKPKDYAPGTKMSFAGLRSEEDRAAVVAYIESAAQ